jgi:hypothetical protein
MLHFGFETALIHKYSMQDAVPATASIIPISQYFFPFSLYLSRSKNHHRDRIAQPRRNPIDRNVNPGLHPLVALPCAPAADQLDLQVVQGVDVGEAVANRLVCSAGP